jgi:hypothetical protein
MNTSERRTRATDTPLSNETVPSNGHNRQTAGQSNGHSYGHYGQSGNGHDWGGYIPPVGPAGATKPGSNAAHPPSRSPLFSVPSTHRIERGRQRCRCAALSAHSFRVSPRRGRLYTTPLGCVGKGGA